MKTNGSGCPPSTLQFLLYFEQEFPISGTLLESAKLGRRVKSAQTLQEVLMDKQFAKDIQKKRAEAYDTYENYFNNVWIQLQVRRSCSVSLSDAA
jgi:hypothetical protein